MAACVADADIIFSSCSLFFLLLFFFLCLISAVADWMSTILPRPMWPLCEFRMHVGNALHVARWKCRIQQIAKNSKSGHHRTNLSGYIFATKACIDNRKNLLNSNTSPTCPHGELRPTNGWDLFGSFGHPSKFQRVSRLGSVTARHSSSGPQPNFAALDRRRHLYSAGRPSRWALAHILVKMYFEHLLNCATKTEADCCIYLFSLKVHWKYGHKLQSVTLLIINIFKGRWV